jgi:succinate dehydrogenase / fumarate reductase flavoprotein subunit
VSRAIYLELMAGNGIDGKDYVYLDVTPKTVNHYFQVDDSRLPDGTLRHLTEHDVEAKLEDIADFCRTYLGIDPAKEPMPIQPTAHYAMGGMPTDVDARVLSDEKNTVVPGLYAAGECACVSVHGANRLGTNSLLDIVVFGKRAGIHMADYVRQVDYPPLPKNPTGEIYDTLERLKNSNGTESGATIREEMQQVMMDHVGVFRVEEGMKKAIAKVRELKERFKKVKVEDKSRAYNLDLLETWEIGNLLDLAEVTAVSALARPESRGGHARDDYQARDDKNWLKHSLVWLKGDGNVELKYKPVTITQYEPKERVY